MAAATIFEILILTERTFIQYNYSADLTGAN